MDRVIAAFLVTFAICAAPAAAQDRPAPAVEVAAGALFFPDDGLATEGFAGGAGRFYVSRLVSVGPEIGYVNGQHHSHLILTGNVTVDLADPDGPVTPFVVAGAGLFRTSEQTPNNLTATHTEGAFTAGGGVRGRIGTRVFVGAEARIGWETHVRVNGFLGVRLGR